MSETYAQMLRSDPEDLFEVLRAFSDDHWDDVQEEVDGYLDVDDLRGNKKEDFLSAFRALDSEDRERFVSAVILVEERYFGYESEDEDEEDESEDED